MVSTRGIPTPDEANREEVKVINYPEHKIQCKDNLLLPPTYPLMSR
jgi:hypothetical protein